MARNIQFAIDNLTSKQLDQLRKFEAKVEGNPTKKATVTINGVKTVFNPKKVAADVGATVSFTKGGVAFDTFAAATAPTPPVPTGFTVTVSSPSVAEGNTGTSNSLAFQLTLDKAPTTPVTLIAATTGGTATAGVDYVPFSGPVTFAAGQTIAFVSIEVRPDATFEADETVVLSVSGSSLIASATGTGTITNDDADIANLPQTFTLTTGVDSGAAFTGGSGNDTFNSAIGGDGTAANGTTLNPGDNLNGGAGIDTLNIAIAGTNTAAQTTAAITLNGIERVMVSNFEIADDKISTIDLGIATGVTTVGLSASSASGDTVFATVKNLVSAEMSNGAADLTINYVGTVVSGSSDAMTLTLGNQTGGTFTADGIETLNVVSGVFKNTVTLAGAQLEAVGVSGDQNLTLGALPGTVKSVDASTFTGNLSATLNALTNVTVTGGAGNDTFTTGAALTGGTVAGGNGTDTLVLAADAHVNTAAIGARYTGFETLAISEAAAAPANRAQDVSLVAGITGIAVTKYADTTDGGAATTGTVGFTNLSSAVTALAISGLSTAEADNDDLALTVSAAMKSDGAADAITVTLGTSNAAVGSTTAVATGGKDVLLNVTLGDHESITLVSQGGANFIGNLTSADLETLTINATKALTINALVGNTATKTIDAAASTANVVISANASTTASTITGGAGNDTFLGSSKADSISGGNGNDSLSGADGNDTIDGGNGNDTLVGGTGIDNLSGGDGDDVFLVGTAAHFAGLTAAETVSGGAGNDTLRFTAGVTLAATDLTAISSIEVIDFNAAADNSITLTDAVFTANGTTTLAIKDTAANALTVNASALGAANSVQVTANTAASTNDNLVGGAGNDTFSFTTKDSATALDANDTVNGGKGTDTLAIALATNSLNAVTLSNVSNIERITVTGTDTLDASITLDTANFVTTDTATTVGVIDASGMTGTGKFLLNASAEGDSALSITGGSGNDTLTGGGKADTISGGNGDDQITGGAGSDNLSGGAGNDLFIVADATHFIALASVETVDGGTGNDTLRFAINAATTVNSTDLLGLRSIETIEFAGNNTSSIILTDAVFTANGATSLTITDADATKALTVNAAAVSAANSLTINANKGADSADTRDSLQGGAGNDTFNFTTESQSDALAAGDTVNGGGGVDTLAVAVAGANALTAVTLTNVSNIERLTVSSVTTSTANASITLADGNFVGVTGAVVNASAFNGALTFSGANEVESTLSITGGSGADNLTGGQKADTIVGGAGADTITGGLGADVLTGGLGADVFVYTAVAQSSGANIDSITDFASGSDRLRVTLDYSGLNSANPVVVNATRANGANANVDGLTNAQALLSGERGQFVYDTTNSRLYINVNNDNFISTLDYTIAVAPGSTPNATIVNGDIEFVVTGTGGADTITGGGGNDTISAGDGADSVVGGAGADSIDGGLGADTISGGDGNDTITGGAGADNLTGGAGADTFVFADSAANNGADTLTDLTIGAGNDVLDFSAFAIDVNATATAPGAALAAVLTANPGASTAIAGTIQRLVDIAGNQDITTANGLTTALAGGGEYANLDMAASSKAIIITSATNGADVDFIFFATSDGAGTITATLVGTTTNNVDIDDYVSANFLI